MSLNFVIIIILYFSKQPSEVSGKRVMLFSYGSGLASALYSLRLSHDHTPTSPLSNLMATLADIPDRLKARNVTPPAEFEAIMKLREETHHKCSYSPVSDIQYLFPGTYYLVKIDEMFRRSYLRVPPTTAKHCSPLLSPLAKGLH